MLATQKWAQDKSIIMALFACHTAAGARDIYEGMQNIKDRRLFDHQFPMPRKLPDWFALYRSHTRIMSVVAEFISGCSEFGEKAVDFGYNMQEFQEIVKRNPGMILQLKPTPEDLQEAIRNLRELLGLSNEELKNDFLETPFNPVTQAKMTQFFTANQMEFAFAFLVTFPCWLFYQTSPTQLYRQARCGNESALEKLLHLDPLMLHDPYIGKKLQALRMANRKSVYARLLEVTHKPFKVSLKKIKESKAAAISLMSHKLNQPLTEPQIRELFDAVAKDTEKDKYAIDKDIANSESLTRALHRKRPDWEKLLEPDRKI